MKTSEPIPLDDLPFCIEPRPEPIKRVAIGRSLRFRILEKFGFKCRYCGRVAGDVKLHIDHIFPVAKGGRTEEVNLCAACEECNGGKRDRVINIPLLPLSIQDECWLVDQMHILKIRKIEDRRSDIEGLEDAYEGQMDYERFAEVEIMRGAGLV